MHEFYFLFLVFVSITNKDWVFPFPIRICLVFHFPCRKIRASVSYTGLNKTRSCNSSSTCILVNVGLGYLVFGVANRFGQLL
jgi:hypothetical protein